MRTTPETDRIFATKHNQPPTYLMDEMKRIYELLETKVGSLEEGENAEHIDQKKVKQLESIIGGKLDTIYTGGSNDGRFVASIKVSGGSQYQFTPDIMKKLLKFNIKYVAGSHDIVNVAIN